MATAAVTVVFAVLVAFGVEEWREERQLRRFDGAGEEAIVVTATNRTTWTIDALPLDPDSGDLTPLLDAPISPDFDEEPYGLCLYHSAASGKQRID